jgi:dihydrodipicolinate synthase/N-acetylneuraminate lyase
METVTITKAEFERGMGLLIEACKKESPVIVQTAVDIINTGINAATAENSADAGGDAEG